MDLQKSSYEFHSGLETPFSFFRREWKAMVVCGGVFCSVMVAAVFLVDPAFFYPRLQTDPLNYFLKAKAFAETGGTSARWAINLPPFPYAAVPGVLRVPFVLAFSDFDDQLRGMQLLNIPIVASVAAMSAFILSWMLPQRRHWMAIAFAFAFTLLSPVWIANVFLPLADAPYAAFTLAALLVSINLLCSPEPLSRRPRLIAIYALLFAISFMLRFTAPVLLVFAAALARGRWKTAPLSRASNAAMIAAMVALVLLLVALNVQAIFGRYLYEPLAFLIRGDKPGMLLNLLGAAIPSQLVPNFQQGFVHPPIDAQFGTTFFESPLDTAWLAVGLVICAVVVIGMWQTRSRLFPETLYVLAPLPVLTVMMPSTTRYLLSYQPFIWIYFYAGAAYLAKRYSPRLPSFARSRFAIASAAVVLAVVVLGLRSWRLAGTASERYFAVTVSRAPAYVSDVAKTFRGLRSFLETLPDDRTLLIGARGTVGRWKVIADRDYYSPDSALSQVMKTKDVYLVAECGTMEACQAWPIWKERLEKRVSQFGAFEFNPVFAVNGERARAEVFRVTNSE